MWLGCRGKYQSRPVRSEAKRRVSWPPTRLPPAGPGSVAASGLTRNANQLPGNISESDPIPLVTVVPARGMAARGDDQYPWLARLPPAISELPQCAGGQPRDIDFFASIGIEYICFGRSKLGPLLIN